jgi:V/A-type H+-transporting ATPase subunit E
MGVLMKTLDKGTDKIQKICDALKLETLEPAKREAEEIISTARQQAEKIIFEAHQQAKKVASEASQRIEKERTVFDSSLQQALRQTLETLRQSIEKMLFNSTLEKELSKEMSDPKVIAKLIDVVIKAIKEEGTSADLSVIIPKNVSASEINTHLLKNTLEQLNDRNLALGQFGGGIQVKLLDQKMTLDISDKALMDFLQQYLRKDFRNRLFTGLTENQD